MNITRHHAESFLIDVVIVAHDHSLRTSASTKTLRIWRNKEKKREKNKKQHLDKIISER